MKRLIINLMANTLSFIISFGISFFLTPYITAAMGEEAYGFISLGNNFVSYATIITAALNSMAARFISVELCKGNDKEANEFFSSVLIANIVLTVVLVIPAILVVVFLEKIINVPSALVFDVKSLLLFLFIAFFITLITSVYSVAPYAKNRTDLSAYRDIFYNLVRAGSLYLVFSIFEAHVWYYGAATIVASLYLVVANVFLHKKLLGEMRFNHKNYKRSSVIILIKSGIWSSVSSLSTTLLEGLDLLIANLFISASAMGVLSIANTLPLAINSMVSTISQVFVPGFIISYAQNDKNLVIDVNNSIKLMSIFSSMPLVVLFVLGKAFFKLWVPTQNSDILHILSILTVGTLVVTATVKPLYAIYVVTNKLKANSLTALVQGVASTAAVFFFLSILPKDTLNNSNNPVGLYIIAGVSSFLGILRAITFTPMYAAYCLKLKKLTFYPAIWKSLVNVIISTILSAVLVSFVNVDSWMKLVVTTCFVCIIEILSGFLFVLNKEEKKIFLSKIKSKFLNKGEIKK